jgi:hypothetical protein
MEEMILIIEGRERVTVLSANHSKFYKVISNPQELKRQTLQWLTTAVKNAKRMENIVFVIIGHGVSSGSVIIGGGTRSKSVDYLTVPEVKKALADVPAGAYFILVNASVDTGLVL